MKIQRYKTEAPDRQQIDQGSVSDIPLMVRNLEPVLNDGVYVYAIVPSNSVVGSIDAIATFREKEGTTVILPESKAQAAGLQVLFRAAWITLKVRSPLTASGLTAEFSRALSNSGISCNVMAAACHDHIFVPVELAEKAIVCLRALQEKARSMQMPGPGRAKLSAPVSDALRYNADEES